MKKKIFPILVTGMTVLGSFNAFCADNTSTSTSESETGFNFFNSIWFWIIIYGALFAAFYFLLIRPNKKKQKEEEERRNNICLNDTVTTIGGIVGRVVSVKDDDITIESSIDRTLVQFKKWAVKEIEKPITDDEPVSEDDKK